MLVPGSWKQVDVAALHDASSLLRARSGDLGRYMPEGRDARSAFDQYVIGYDDVHRVLREQVTQDLHDQAARFRDAATMLRGQHGLGAVADAIDGSASLFADAVEHVPTNQLSVYGRKLQDAANDASRIARMLDVLADRGGRVPADVAATRERIFELTTRPFGRQAPDDLQELSYLGDLLPPELSLPRPPRSQWEEPMRDALIESNDPEYGALLRRLQIGRVADLHGFAHHPAVDDALARIDELAMIGRGATIDDLIELGRLLGRRDVRERLPTYEQQRIMEAIQEATANVDAAPTPTQRARLDHALGYLAVTRHATSPERLVDLVLPSLRTPRAQLDAFDAGTIEGYLDPALLDSRVVRGSMLFEPTESLPRLLSGVTGSSHLTLKPNTDMAWVEATLDSALLGMRTELELAAAGRLSTAHADAPARLAALARRDMDAADTLEAHYLLQKHDVGVFGAAEPSATGRVSLGLRLAAAEQANFGNEHERIKFVRGYLTNAQQALREVQANPGDIDPGAIAQLDALIERNLRRMRVLGDEGDGYRNHPDAAEIGAASQLAQLLDRLDASAGSQRAATDVLTW